MSARWAFFAFDWERFAEVAPVIQRARETGEFAHTGLEGAEEVLSRLPEDWTEEEACNALVLMTCGEGEPAEFGGGLAERLLEIRRTPEGEDFADMLGHLMTAEPNLEDWFRAEGGLAGALDAEQTRLLAEQAGSLGPSTCEKSARKGLGGLARLFSPAQPGQNSLDDLLRLIRAASSAGMGIGVLREP